MGSTLVSILPPPTVSVAEPEMAPDDAVMMIVPAATGVARPELLIVAILVFDDVHDTREVRSRVVLSMNVPVAVNC